MFSPFEKYDNISKTGGKIRCLILKTDFVFPLPCELIPASKVLRQEAYCCTDQTSTSPVFIFVYTQRIAAFTSRKRHFICSNGLQANGIKLFALTGVPKPHVDVDKSLVLCLKQQFIPRYYLNIYSILHSRSPEISGFLFARHDALYKLHSVLGV